MAATIIPLICLGVIVGVFVMIFWQARQGRLQRQPHGPVVTITEEEMDRRREELRDKLSRRPFGETRARRLWAKLMASRNDEGFIHEFHRDFCGHGLIRQGGGIILCDILDGTYPGKPIARWTDEEDFVAFFARQSDFTCSGWEPQEPVFFTEDPWYRNNQRITTAKIDRYL
ncbi:hypothetical protein LJR030_001665 [Rhizobium sp. LjRoot30]|uniref:hypothetical protein n=1 Tax=Rhizobium sp. LjRoot30 TaxID=3342320 RepID=UPI003ECE198C